MKVSISNREQVMQVKSRRINLYIYIQNIFSHSSNYGKCKILNSSTKASIVLMDFFLFLHKHDSIQVLFQIFGKTNQNPNWESGIRTLCCSMYRLCTMRWVCTAADTADWAHWSTAVWAQPGTAAC